MRSLSNIEDAVEGNSQACNADYGSILWNATTIASYRIMTLKGLILMLAVYASCSGEKRYFPSFTEFDFSYNDTWSSSFSIMFTATDSVYVKQHFWYGAHRESDSDLKEGGTYIGALNEQERLVLDSFITNINFNQYDTSYFNDRLKDGISYEFYLHTDSIKKTIRLYGDSAPAALLSLGRWIADIKDRLTLFPIDSNIIFNSYRPLPPLKLDLRKFVPPASHE